LQHIRIGVLDRVIGTAYLGTLGKDTLFTAALEVFLPHPVKPPCVELSAAKPPFSQKHFPKTDLGNFLGFGDRIFGEMENSTINFIALFIENIELIEQEIVTLLMKSSSYRISQKRQSEKTLCPRAKPLILKRAKSLILYP